MKKKNETFSMMVILLIPVAIAINIVGGQMTSILKIPVDLDMIGVILVGALAGPLPAAVTGVLTNLINGIFDPTWIPYAFCAFFIGISSGLLSKYNMMTKVWKLVISGIIIALVGTITATPITVFFLWRSNWWWCFHVSSRINGNRKTDFRVSFISLYCNRKCR